MPDSIVYNCDCMAYMKTLPDKTFELAVVDPPFGDAGQKAKKREQGAHIVDRGRQKRYAEAYDERSQIGHVERESKGSTTASETPEADSSDTSVSRTGGTWAAKYGKKS